MSPSARWQQLPGFPDLPALYISPFFEASSYAVHVTDLANVWVERLDRRGILKRSLIEDTSIDLSDGDPTQWAVFLQKLGAAFDATCSDHQLTNLAISASSAGNLDDLTLHITYLLPEPLKPLKWPIHLTKCPPSHLASELVIPLVQAHQARTNETEQLVAKLKEKDAIIAKLVDKLEATGTGLEHVFNSLSGKRKVSRAIAEEKINGLAPFAASGWDMTPNVFNLNLAPDSNGAVAASDQLNDWWSGLSSRPKSAIQGHKTSSSHTRVSQKSATPEAQTANEEGDDFQVQATPPHLRSTRNERQHGATSDQDDDDTTDDDHAGRIKSEAIPTRERPRGKLGTIGNKKASPPAQSRAPASAADDETASDTDGDQPMEPNLEKPTKKAGGGLGAIRGNKERPTPTPSPAPNDGDGDDDGDDETASSSDSGNEQPPPKSPAKPLASGPKRGGIGVIGRRPRPAPATTSPDPEEEPSSANPSAQVNAAAAATLSPSKHATGIAGRSKIGAIGGRKAAATAAAAASEDSSKRTRPESPPAAEQQQQQQQRQLTEEPEDEEQKAERRRAELARELEKKAAAAPAKKKRRF